MKHKKYHRRMRPFATLLAVALLIAGVAGVYRMGWRQGYGQAWMWAQPREDEAPAPSGAPFAPWGPRAWGGGPLYRGYYPVHRGHLGRLGSLLLVMLGGVLVLKAVRHRAWHAHHAARGGAPPHAPWRHGPWPHKAWGCSPQDKADDAETPPADEQVAKVKPEPKDE